ncbi:MarR family transcriptional regulator [Kutzneria sp. NPDC051319]|uniref:MarR family winged helix-turn-helix transcriptional regulator n=1 Tax=Kutzneria sp. NPDC051319 TaxID=3155047 RepID=UPI00342CC93A
MGVDQESRHVALEIALGMVRIVRQLQDETGEVLIGHSQIAALHVLDRTGTRTPTELGVVLGLSQPAVSALIKRLLCDGLIIARSDRTDRRKSNLILTEEGLRRLDSLRAAMTTTMLGMVNLMPAAERAGAEQALRTLPTIICPRELLS